MELAQCHPNRKVKAKGLCGSCYDKQLKASNPKYVADQLSNSKKWALAHPEQVKQHKINRRLKESADPNSKLKRRAQFLLKKIRTYVR